MFWYKHYSEKCTPLYTSIPLSQGAGEWFVQAACQVTLLKIVLLCPPGHHHKVTFDISRGSFILTAYIPANITGNAFCALFWFA